MDDVATEAGVGKGTLYRRFVDKGGLAVALLNEREGDLQQLMLTGPPPLGPGAEPSERLVAFTAAYLTFLDSQLDLVLMSQTSSPGARLRSGAHRFWRQHCRLLLQAAGTADPGILADVLLAALSAEQVRHWLRDDALPVCQLADRLSGLARSLTALRP